MPNHCHNRVTFYSDDTTAILKLHKIFLKGIETDDNTEPNDTVFGSFIPEPDWSKIPLTEETCQEYSLTVFSVNGTLDQSGSGMNEPNTVSFGSVLSSVSIPFKNILCSLRIAVVSSL